MGGRQKSEILGVDAHFAGHDVPEDGVPDPAGMGGKSGEVVYDVDWEWNETVRVTTPQPEINGRTSEEVWASLGETPTAAWKAKWWTERGKKWKTEWGNGLGRAGGRLWVEKSTWEGKYVAVVRMDFLLVVPDWVDRDGADAESQARWDGMMESLMRHEERHVSIAAEAAEELAESLKGKFVSQIAAEHRKACEKMQANQVQLDIDSKNGTDKDHPYGGVTF